MAKGKGENIEKTKEKLLEATINEITKAYGPGAIMTLDD